MISEDIKWQILDNTDIVREIGELIPLKRYGQSSLYAKHLVNYKMKGDVSAGYIIMDVELERFA